MQPWRWEAMVEIVPECLDKAPDQTDHPLGVWDSDPIEDISSYSLPLSFSEENSHQRPRPRRVTTKTDSPGWAVACRLKDWGF